MEEKKDASEESVTKPFEQKEITLDIELEATDDRQREMLKALILHLGVVSYAVKTSGIPRRTHYNWMKSNDRYKESVNLINEAAIDYAESRLYSSIEHKDMRAITFILRTKGKYRGYTQSVEKMEMPRPVLNVIVKDSVAADAVQRMIDKP